MANLNNTIRYGLNQEFNSVFDGIKPVSLSSNFGAQVGNNFDQAANEINLGMAPA